MEVEFETNDADRLAFQEAAPPPSWWMELAVFFGLFLVYCGPAFLPYFVSGRPISGAIFLAIFSAIWIWMLIHAKRQERKKFLTGNRIRIHLDPRGLVEGEEHATSWVAWSLFEKVNTLPGAIQLLLKTKTHLLIPTRAFASEEEKTRFVELAEQYRAAASDSPGADFPSQEDEGFPTWARGITQSIDYQNKADELAFVANNGVPPTKRPNVYVSTLLSFAWLSGALGVFALGIAYPAPTATASPPARDLGGDFGILMCFASVVWFVAALIGTSTVVRWVNRIRMPATFLTPRRLTMGAKGYFLQSSLMTLCGDWKNLSQVDQNVEFLALKNQYQQHICVVPKKAFPTPQLAQEFADEAQLYWQDAQQPEEAEVADDAIAAEAADGDNPFRSPHA
ncbi:hypothetical protein LOC68_13695 [Blastopirellula sp. JC732]|uniref:YcxB family protein n=1 Tax=Blastopirellula sediminis TaxID=2894196 RepID=A0A9X1MLV7_9BACT|nr:hypothetical protein [Blastopirellula sediminis]MCC9607259.1 hypothetical protein [Blastopirellula sediminis]MCC9629448.1 hypothetical protein [Blastopirellula sediminis]